jgi:S-adenosylmethionine decarboxylase
MFTEHNSSGKHMLCDFRNITNKSLLNTCEELVKLLIEICHRNNFQVLNHLEYKFHPIGCSIILLLSESHISIHTFPEKNHMSFDIYTCRQYKDDSVYLEIYDFLLDKLGASKESSCDILDRYF